MSECKLMAHMVACYPDREKSLAVAAGLAEGGADYLEVQFPFSDPSADGPVIERACQTALDNGFKVADGFNLMERLAGMLNIPLFIMTYGSLVFARGADEFARHAKAAGVHGLIIPDLPPDYDEKLFEAGLRHGLAVVPVIAPEISEARLKLIGGLKPEFIYTALRLGITGGASTLDEKTIAYLGAVAALGAKTIAGFGVRSREQMRALAGRAHAAAVGSHFLAVLNAAGPDADIKSVMAEAARKLTRD